MCYKQYISGFEIVFLNRKSNRKKPVSLQLFVISIGPIQRSYMNESCLQHEYQAKILLKVESKKNRK